MVNKTFTKLTPASTLPIQVVMLVDKDGNTLNSFGSAANIPIAAGDVAGFAHVNKFGYRNTVPNTFQTVWDGAVDYAYQSAAVVSAVADDTISDNNGTVLVEGLDETYAPVSETITIGGSASTSQFVRVFRAIMITANTGDTNVDEVRIKNTGTDVAIITAGAGQTLMAVYTIPAGKTGYLLKVSGSIDANNDALFRLYARPFNGSFNVKMQKGVFAAGFDYEYPVPLEFTEKTDLEIKATSQNNVGAGATFDLILKDN